MTLSTKREIYTLSSNNLVFRDSADSLLSNVEECRSQTILVDFTNIENISRAFAHQYLRNKQKSKKTIEEINTNLYVQKMFEKVSSTMKN